jgi:hypothetical protein
MDFDIDFDLTPFNEPVCDFCTNPEQGEVFTCPKLDMVGVSDTDVIHAATLTEEWAACGDCAKLIRARDMEGLIARVMASEAILFPEIGAEFVECLRVPYREIFRALDHKAAVSN